MNSPAVRRGTWLGPIVAIYWLAMFAATHLPQAALPTTHLGDKTEHFSAYCLLTYLLCLWLPRRWPGIRFTPLVALALCMAYGAVDELTQPIVNRFCDIRDWLADFVGGCIAVGLFVGTSLVFRSRYRAGSLEKDRAQSAADAAA